MRHIRASACPHLALAEYEDLAPPRARSPHRPRPPSPSYLYPRAPRARRPPREREDPERRASASVTTSTAASPRVRGLGASPRALGAALLLALAPRTPRARRPPREREGSVQRPVALASFALSPRSSSYLHPIRAPPSRSPNPIRGHDASPRERKESLLRHPRTCTARTPREREGAGRWLCTRITARESSCSRGRRSRPASVYWDDTRRISARVRARAEAGTERCAVQQATSARTLDSSGDEAGSGVLRRQYPARGDRLHQRRRRRMEKDVGAAWCLERED
ncbi:hypothetical protein DFH09DRAFT_1441198 [Mycena vulgaris]|nr:hypothetical protein DFH09DRAFT_1441198 [Mycena vulgaris]